MPRLPIVGGDDGDWGDYLNTFLEVSLDNTNVDEAERGKLKPSAVDASGAVMNTDTSTASMDFVVDEDAMTSNSATKVPTQQSVKAYVDSGISSKANDADVVKLAGTQTITGSKNFSGGLSANGGAQGGMTVVGFGGGIIQLRREESHVHPTLQIHGTDTPYISFGAGNASALDTKIERIGSNNLGFDGAKLSNLSDPTSSQDSATKSYVDTGLTAKANDVDVVKLTGNQTVAGAKTFTSPILYDAGTNGSVLIENAGSPYEGGLVSLRQDVNDTNPQTALHAVFGLALGDGTNDPDTVLSRAGVANASFNSSRVSDVADPTSAQDAATKAYVDTAKGILLQASSGAAGAGNTTSPVPLFTTITVPQGTLNDGDSVTLDCRTTQQNSSGGSVTFATQISANSSPIGTATLNQATNAFVPHAHFLFKLTRMNSTTVMFTFDSIVSSALNIAIAYRNQQQVVSAAFNTDTTDLNINMATTMSVANANAIVTPTYVLAKVERL